MYGQTEKYENPNYRVMYEKMLSDPYIKSHFGMKVAICQHPMYLLIDEDRGVPIVGERELPWGSPDAGVYVDRVKRNLGALEKHDDFYLNYQFSAVEIESMVRDFPEVGERMKYWYNNGRLDFVDGLFSQAHVHTLGSESNWRQIEFGKQFFMDYFGKDVTVYGRQETGFHSQLPQLLKMFGYNFMTSPQFPHVLEILDGSFETIVSRNDKDFIRGSEFVNATSLDGTSVPFYFSMGGGNPDNDSPIGNIFRKDLYAPPPIRLWYPDMIEVGGKLHEKITSLYDFVLLEPALKERIQQVPPKATARIHSYWSYNEGTWAEELLRTNVAADRLALLAESMQCMAKLAGSSVDYSDELQKIWHSILKYQHHDISWNEVTDLRRRSINHFKDGMKANQQIMDDIAASLVEKDDGAVSIFNGLPRARRALIDTDKKMAPGDGRAFQRYEDRYIGFRDLPAGGFASFEKSEQTRASVKRDMPKTIATDHYQVTLSANGLIEQLVTNDGTDLLRAGKYLGGEMRALIAEQWVDNRTADCIWYEGEVCNILERRTSLGDIPVLERYFFFRHENLIQVELEFDFDGNEVGYFWIDETKINVYYPTVGSDVYHDIPFGYEKGKPEKPLFAPNWIYSSGLAYINHGTVKHWTKDGVLANVIAWGGDVFSNRQNLFGRWSTRPSYDIHLYGKQKIQYHLVPLGKFDDKRILRAVENITAPVHITSGRGTESYFEVSDSGLATTAVYHRNGVANVRGYALPSGNDSKFRDYEIFNGPLSDLKAK